MTHRPDFISMTRPTPTPSLSRAAAVALILAAGVAASALAQNAVAADKDTDKKQSAAPATPAKELLADFMHFVLVDNLQVAAARGQELLDRKLPPIDFVNLVEGTGEMAKFEDAVGRAIRLDQTQAVAAGLHRALEAGQLARARNPEQIALNIKALTSTVRAKLQAKERLRFAGEYAMPQLLGAFLDNSNPIQQQAVKQQITEMGRHAITPLATALPALPGEQQEAVAEVLGLIPQRMSLPYLCDLRDQTKNANVRQACERSIQRLGGDGGNTAAQLYAQLGEGYYAQRLDVTSFPGEDHQLLWSFAPQTGLTMEAIKTPVFHEAMAMRHAERALSLTSENPDVLALWIASNLKREIETPAGYANPAYPTKAAPGNASGNLRREAEYFAVAAGPSITQRVLARALDTRNPQLARRAIGAIDRTAGGAGLWGGNERKPLIEAVTFPNRRVQYEAALALATAQPREAFAGAERVVPTLAGAIRDAGTQYAAVLASDTEAQQGVRKMLEAAGFKVLPPGRSAEDLAAPLAETPAVDVVVIHSLTAARVGETVEALRGQPKLLATPVLILTSTESAIELDRRFDSDAMVAVRQASIGEATLAKAVQTLVTNATGGPISPEEALGYSIRSLAAMRDLAISGNSVLQVGDAASTLIGVLENKETKPGMRNQVAEILSRLDQERCQRSLMDAAVAATGEERLRLMAHVAGSAKRFGNKLEQRHVSRLLDMASTGADAEATAAAALMGALNLPNSELVPLILKK